MIYRFIRPLLFLLNPEVAHAFTLSALKWVMPAWRVKKRLARFSKKPVRVFGLSFPNPIGLAAGLDKNADYLDALFGLGFGFIEVGAVTPLPQAGNPKPRLFRIPEAEALINRMGFNNKGLDHMVAQLKQRKVPGIVGVNLGKNKETPLERAFEDYRICFEGVYPFVDFVTINISSPNTPGLRELQGKDYLDGLLCEMKKTQAELIEKTNRTVPMLLKVTLDLPESDYEDIINLSLKHGIAGIITSNTSLDFAAVKPWLKGNEAGGLSGRPLFKKSTEMVRKIHQLSSGKLPIIAVGGIQSPEDALAKFEAGASLIQLYTGLIYQGPELVILMLDEL